MYFVFIGNRSNFPISDTSFYYRYRVEIAFNISCVIFLVFQICCS